MLPHLHVPRNGFLFSPDWVKVNCDDSLVVGESGLGIGFCLWDSSGGLIHVVSSFKNVPSSIFLAELVALASGLALAMVLPGDS